MMEDKKELDVNEIGQADGGMMVKLRFFAATVCNGPGWQYARIATISSGCSVNYTGSVSTDADGNTWHEISSPTRGWICDAEG